jgi:putative heme-binding domain-containing protein
MQNIVCGLVVSLCLPLFAAEQSEDAQRTALAVEALSRMQGVDIEQNPKLKQTILKVLERTRGTPDFVKLDQQFKIKDQESGLLEVAVKNPSSEDAVEAMRLILSSGKDTVIRQGLQSTNSDFAVRTAEALGNAGEKEASLRLLLPIIEEPRNSPALRKQAVRSLARTYEGAASILKLARQDKLAEDLKFTASSELNRARWPGIKEQASTLLPSPQGQNSQPLPALADLLNMKGNIANGAKVFSSPTVGCNNCHQVKGQGIDFGPNLSEIGTKLGKDALYEAILNPSAGISFGYEAWQVELKAGDEAYGLLATETADEIVIKSVGGILTRYKKSDILKKEQTKLSIMPAGLQQSMTTKELVDLVEYLASLKKI